tara:strand:- start:34348 stop:35316 length:969 start_codon:yes stop_codon:yes gene_type:complete
MELDHVELIEYDDDVEIVEKENIKPKRGRKPKVEDPYAETNEDRKPKKRGRKPKGGKIVKHIPSVEALTEDTTSIILHLKCSMEDLATNNTLSDIKCFNHEDMNIKNSENTVFINVTKEPYITTKTEDTSDYKNSKDANKLLCQKLNDLQKKLHTNNVDDKQSACFWCTYDFDSHPIYIPKHHIKNSYHVYGCFCSPECATAYLMKENIDSSSKFERYHLLNYIYSKIYDYKTSVKPAPNPEYMLDKFYGTLTIQEYRALLKNDRLFLVVDKPLTRIMPELHEDNDDFIISNKSIASNSYQIKKNLKKEVKTDILNKNFGLA